MTSRPKVQLTFFCELDRKNIQALFGEPSLPSRLRTLDARVSLGILDLSDERAEVVRCLNRAGVPVIAWQLLPREQGYWYNLRNTAEAAAGYAGFRAWTAREGLQWAGIGVDIEPDIGEFQQLLSQPLRFMGAVVKRGWSKKRYNDARGAYETLVLQMRGDGFPVHSYAFPFIADEQRTGSTLLQRLLGVTDVAADERVLMLYSSFFRPIGDAILWSYAQTADAVGVGLTGGGVEMGGVEIPDPMTWEELARDLGIAARWCRNIHNFSLEGCLRQGFLDRLENHDWNRPAHRPMPWVPAVAAFRILLQAGLWTAARAWAVLALLTGGLALLAS